MDTLFREESQYIYMYSSTETDLDPYEHNVQVTRMNALPIKALVTDLTFTKVQWAMPGIDTNKAKEIVIEKKHEGLLKLTYKIKIDNDYYEGWTINGRLQYRLEQNYIRAYVYIKKV